MSNKIILKRTSIAGRVPTTSNLELGELGINTTDGRVFLNQSGSSIEEFLVTNTGNIITGSLSMSGSLTTIGSVVSGVGSVASGEASHAEGSSTSATGQGSHTEGGDTVANGDLSHAEGYGTTANGLFSHTEGNLSNAIGDYSHAEGESTTAAGTTSHAEGYGSLASGSYSHAEGQSTTAVGEGSHAEGVGTYAVGGGSHAEGYGSLASGSYSHAEGATTTATGASSHAEGADTVATGEGSHAEGYGSLASGNYSHAEGESTTANGQASHTEGLGTIASGSYQHVSGKYNLHRNTSSLAIIGNGTADGNRSDLVNFNQSGVVFYAPITGSIISGSFYGDGSNLTGIVSSNWTASGDGISRFSNVRITGSLTVSGSTQPFTVYGSGSDVMRVIGSTGTLFTIDDDTSGNVLEVANGNGYNQFVVEADGDVLTGDAEVLQTLHRTSYLLSSVNVSQSITTFVTSSYTAAFFDYTVASASNARAGSIMSVWNGSNINYTETSTTAIGDTSGVSFTVELSASLATLRSVTTTANWTIKTTTRAI